jgi:hypothetical protein
MESDVSYPHSIRPTLPPTVLAGRKSRPSIVAPRPAPALAVRRTATPPSVEQTLYIGAAAWPRVARPPASEPRGEMDGRDLRPAKTVE